ncbi:MAG: hypothetical protein WAV31_06570 [Candidatus Moraniibacteriota bacterium]
MNEQKNEDQVNKGKSNAADFKGELNKFESFLEEYMVKKAPFALPLGAKEFIAAVSPYLIILSAIMLLPIILAAMGLTAILTPFAMMGGYGLGYGFGWGFGAIISLIIAVITIVMELMAVPGLFKRTKSAWRLLFYVSIVSLIGSIISIHGIIGGIIGAIIGWYVLFQMKDMYKN